MEMEIGELIRELRRKSEAHCVSRDVALPSGRVAKVAIHTCGGMFLFGVGEKTYAKHEAAIEAALADGAKAKAKNAAFDTAKEKFDAKKRAHEREDTYNQ